MVALVVENGPSGSMSDIELASIAGVPTRAITSMRAGIGDWVLEYYAPAVAS